MAIDQCSSTSPYQSTTRPVNHQKYVKSPYAILTNIHSNTGFGRVVSAVFSYILKSRHRSNNNAPCQFNIPTSHRKGDHSNKVCQRRLDTPHFVRSGRQNDGTNQDTICFESETSNQRLESLRRKSSPEILSDHRGSSKQILSRCYSHPNVINQEFCVSPKRRESFVFERKETSTQSVADQGSTLSPVVLSSADQQDSPTKTLQCAPCSSTHDSHKASLVSDKRVYELCCDNMKVKASTSAVIFRDGMLQDRNTLELPKQRTSSYCTNPGATAETKTRDLYLQKALCQEQDHGNIDRCIRSFQLASMSEKSQPIDELEMYSEPSTSGRAADGTTSPKTSESFVSRNLYLVDPQTVTLGSSTQIQRIRPEPWLMDETTLDELTSYGDDNGSDIDAHVSADELSINCNQPMVKRTGRDTYRIRREDDLYSSFQERFPSLGEDIGIPPWEMLCNQVPIRTPGSPEKQPLVLPFASIPPVNTGFDDAKRGPGVSVAGTLEHEPEASSKPSQPFPTLGHQQPFIRYSEKPASIQAVDILLGDASHVTAAPKNTPTSFNDSIQHVSFDAKPSQTETASRSLRKTVSAGDKPKVRMKQHGRKPAGSSSKAKTLPIRSTTQRPASSDNICQQNNVTKHLKKSSPRYPCGRNSKVSPDRKAPTFKVQKPLNEDVLRLAPEKKGRDVKSHNPSPDVPCPPVMQEQGVQTQIRLDEEVFNMLPEVKKQIFEDPCSSDMTNNLLNFHIIDGLPSTITGSKSQNPICMESSEGGHILSSKYSSNARMLQTPEKSFNELSYVRNHDIQPKSPESKSPIKRCRMSKIISNQYTPSPVNNLVCSTSKDANALEILKQIESLENSRSCDAAAKGEDTDDLMFGGCFNTESKQYQGADNQTTKGRKYDIRAPADIMATESELDQLTSMMQFTPSSKQSNLSNSLPTSGKATGSSTGIRPISVKQQAQMMEKGYALPTTSDQYHEIQEAFTFNPNYCYPTPSLLENWIESFANFDFRRAVTEDRLSEKDVEVYSTPSCKSVKSNRLMGANNDGEESDGWESTRNTQSGDDPVTSKRYCCETETNDSRQHVHLKWAENTLTTKDGRVVGTSESSHSGSDEFHDALSAATEVKKHGETTKNSDNVHKIMPRRAACRISGSATTCASSSESLYKTADIASQAGDDGLLYDGQSFAIELGIEQCCPQYIDIDVINEISEDQRKDIRTTADSATFSIAPCEHTRTYTIEEDRNCKHVSHKGKCTVSRNSEKENSKKKTMTIAKELKDKQRTAKTTTSKVSRKHKKTEIQTDKEREMPKEQKDINRHIDSAGARKKSHSQEIKDNSSVESKRSNMPTKTASPEMVTLTINEKKQHSKRRDRSMPNLSTFADDNKKEGVRLGIPDHTSNHPLQKQITDSQVWTMDDRFCPISATEITDKWLFSGEQHYHPERPRGQNSGMMEELHPDPLQTPPFSPQDTRCLDYLIRQNAAQSLHGIHPLWSPPEIFVGRESHENNRLPRYASLGHLDHRKPSDRLMANINDGEHQPLPKTSLSLTEFFYDVIEN